MFKKNQKVKRVVGNDGCFPAVGSVAFIESVIDEDTLTLTGCGSTRYIASQFTPEGPIEAPVAPQVSELMEALNVVDRWNRIQPLSQMVSVEAHCAQDGGSVFLVGQSFDTNSVAELFDHLVQEVSKEDLKVLAQRFTSMVGKL